MRSLAFILLFALSTAALAQGRTQKRPASVLRGEDDADPPPSKPSTTASESCGDPDRALGLALSYAFEQAPEEIRVIAIEDLGLLGDPRALDALAALVLDSNPRIQVAAVRAAASFNTLRATQILENVVRHPRLPMPLKEQALRSLPFHRRPRVRDFLAAVSKAPSYPLNLRKIAQESLAAFDPPREMTGAIR